MGKSKTAELPKIVRENDDGTLTLKDETGREFQVRKLPDQNREMWKLYLSNEVTLEQLDVKDEAEFAECYGPRPKGLRRKPLRHLFREAS